MHKILVVDDDKAIARGIEIRLVSAGYQVMVAHDAMVAVGQALKHKPDVIILDISMPAADGFWVAETVHALPLTRDLPIIFITASKRPELRDAARRAGGVAYLEKPFDLTELTAAIGQAVADRTVKRI